VFVIHSSYCFNCPLSSERSLSCLTLPEANLMPISVNQVTYRNAQQFPKKTFSARISQRKKTIQPNRKPSSFGQVERKVFVRQNSFFERNLKTTVYLAVSNKNRTFSLISSLTFLNASASMFLGRVCASPLSALLGSMDTRRRNPLSRQNPFNIGQFV
jgi:hypothetical protein